MSNVLSALLPTLFTQALPTLRNTCAASRVVNKSWSEAAAEKGQIISIPIGSDVAVTDVTPGPYAPDPGSISPTTATIPLDQWKEAAFTLSEKEVADSIAGVAPMQLQNAVKALAEGANAFILAQHKKIYGVVGTAGTTPFASVSDAINARKLLAKQKAPTNDRAMIINPDAEASAMSLANFNQYLQSADPSVIQKGDLGEKLGFTWLMDQQVATHVSTPLTSGAATINATSAGANTVSIAKATNPSPLVAGDIITFAGDSQTYTVVADVTLAVGNTNVQILPALQVSQAGGAAVSLIGSHVVNLAMHRDCIGFASRALADDDFGNSQEDSYTDADPVSGLVMRVSFRKEYRRTRFSVDMLYGAACVRPELGVRVLG